MDAEPVQCDVLDASYIGSSWYSSLAPGMALIVVRSYSTSHSGQDGNAARSVMQRSLSTGPVWTLGSHDTESESVVSKSKSVLHESKSYNGTLSLFHSSFPNLISKFLKFNERLPTDGILLIVNLEETILLRLGKIVLLKQIYRQKVCQRSVIEYSTKSLFDFAAKS